MIAWIHEGVGFDVESFRIVGAGLSERGFGVYAGLDQASGHRWPYPPGYFPWIYVAARLVGSGSELFPFLIKLPFVLSDLGIALVVYIYLRATGATQRTQYAALALVALGPSFILISALHGQLDAVAILPAAAAFLVWRTWDDPRRSIAVGVLIGLGTAVKTVPIALLITFWPETQSWRERFQLAGSAVLVALVPLVPFLARSPSDVRAALTHAGIPGIGGLSLVVQPDLAGWWMGRATELRGVGELLWRYRAAVVVLAALVVLGAVVRWSAPAIHGAVLLWLAVYAFAPNFAFQYVVWGLPFFLMAGYGQQVAGAQAVLLPASVMLYATTLYGETTLQIYVVVMCAIWALTVVAFLAEVKVIRSLAQTRR